MHNIESPRTDDAGIEAELAAKSTAPRVALADVEGNIASEHYLNVGSALAACGLMASYDTPLSCNLLTICVLVLRNGFTVTGESACASPENFNAEIGRKLARAKAIDKVWMLLGYALRDKIAAGHFDQRVTDDRPPYQQRVIAEKAELDERLAKLHAFFETDTFRALPQDEVSRLSNQAHYMGGYSHELGLRIASFTA